MRCYLLHAAFAREIPKGAHALLRLVNSVSTRTAQQGDFVYLRTATPIVTDGAILVPVDSYVQGVVTHAKRSGRVKGRAELGIRIEILTLPGGKVIRMAPSLASVDSDGSEQKRGGQRGPDAAGHVARRGRGAHRGHSAAGAAIGGMADNGWKGAGIGAGVGSAVGLATVLLTRGKEVELHQGSTIDVIFDRPVRID